VTWKRPGLRFLTVFTLVYMLSFLPFIIADRYRMPIIPLFLLLSACAIEWLTGAFAAARTRTATPDPAAKRGLGLALAGLAAMAVFVNGSWFPTMTPALWAADYWNAGNRFRIQNKFPEAEEQYVKAVSIDDRNHEIWNNLGEVQYYQHSDGYYNLAMCYLALKQTTPARELLQEAIRRDPENETARKELQALESGVPPAAPTAVSATQPGAATSGPGQ
jgi:tetratricopeptide (TPR) repeat protein